MSYLKAALYRKQKELEELITILNNSDCPQPVGKLRVSRRRGKDIYYHRTAERPGEPGYLGKYIKKEDRHLAVQLAQYEYERKLREETERQYRMICKVAENYDPDELKNLYESLHPGRKALIQPFVEPDELFVKHWEAESYTGKGFSAADIEIYTERGERVRSKSEKIIADKLYAMKIPYKYEVPLPLKGFGIVYPDFVVLNAKQRKVYYWEHLGMMEQPDYAAAAVQKLEQYQKNGIFPGDKLILTYETKTRPLNTKLLEQCIIQYLLI
ncbi:hypothetical protein [Fusibacillus kribbianus]|uniref:Uncharacterized protein n=1 Tax=Fusibacillus kribbianus TaxID=3044208 RepID=A0AAP4BCH8_9FIRM|nr:hypothetical protein [Ruminococcus sp. YH-rum2234]MDI9242196.1 hypothetical protein [Ruminococcus sp. YH-rum2234]